MKMVLRILAIIVIIIFANLSHAKIENPRIFQGEQSLGTVAGAPLSTDTNNQVTSGISNIIVSSTVASTCTTTDGTLNSMTTTPVAGTYLVIFGSDFNSTGSGIVVTLTYNVGGSNVTVTQRRFMPFAGGTLTAGSQRVQQALNAIITVNGAQAIAVHCSTSSSTVSTASMELDLVRLL